MTQYQASAPGVKPDICEYFEQFYQTSDSPEAHEKYSESFTNDAKLIMASNEVNGRDEILKLRKGMWEKVAKRSHHPKKIYPLGSDPDEVMLYGTVDYELKDGKKTGLDWSARARFAKEYGVLKMEFYQVYLDTAAMSKAK